MLDAGSKTLAADKAPWASGHGRLLDHPDARIVQMSEHHAVVDMAGASLPALGSTVRVVPNHCCNAINLANAVDVVRNGTLVDTWAVAARGHEQLTPFACSSVWGVIDPALAPRRRAGESVGAGRVSPA
ncbi:D-threonine aldolase [Dermacoccus nishinomiyaensis]|uniref:hypothetical protein n=1 Tax=Dermacoccus nishinomiyaensis TaxID=1274 RepID=UPI000DFC4FB0|nr:D-threonine aldolase [Dermacoccus nishinomiyaensis]